MCALKEGHLNSFFQQILISVVSEPAEVIYVMGIQFLFGMYTPDILVLKYTFVICPTC